MLFIRKHPFTSAKIAKYFCEGEWEQQWRLDGHTCIVGHSLIGYFVSLIDFTNIVGQVSLIGNVDLGKFSLVGHPSLGLVGHTSLGLISYNGLSLNGISLVGLGFFGVNGLISFFGVNGIISFIGFVGLISFNSLVGLGFIGLVGLIGFISLIGLVSLIGIGLNGLIGISIIAVSFGLARIDFRLW